jgi:hypothetical protein
MAPGDGRNNSGFWLACQLRDNCHDIGDAEAAMREYLPPGPVGLVSFLDFPAGLNAEETERYLRGSGPDVCRLRVGKEHEGPAGMGVQVAS